MSPRPARPWFRFYSETLDNRKAQELGRTNPALYFLWTNLLCLANISTPRGALPPLRDIAFALRMDSQEAFDVLQELVKRRFVKREKNRYAMKDWSDWNPDSDANLTPARAKRHEGQLKERGRNAERTPMERIDQIREERDKEKEPERDQEGIVVPVVRAFERCFGRMLGPMEIELIRALDEEHPRERIDYALRESAALGKRSVRYIQTICENQAKDNDSHAGKPVGRNAAPAQAPIDTLTAIYAAYPSMQQWRDVDPGTGDGGLAPVDGNDDPPRLEVRR